jgi:hypothetical protein
LRQWTRRTPPKETDFNALITPSTFLMVGRGRG